ncbi:hypothetical protein CVT24_007472 [Panaeolus cyanescens]|uniref:G-protein coupled receptors family 1 profile domain-containing protein n=1 Tax=Panaeolus cyanescens TaxID=181874 RepID=A0A409YL89_9AGAR|nr:hypothetical protein CVT24_007472 [Panaeolus cyanescens]
MSYSDPSTWGPEGTPHDIYLEKTFIAGDFVCGLGYGVQLVLYIACARYLWRVRQSRGRTSTFLLCYMTLLLLIETLFAAVQARTVEDIYISNRNYPGGPWAYFLETQYLAVNVIFYATLFLLTFLSDLLVLWRCWVIWSGAGKRVAYIVIIFPSMVLMGSFALGTIWTLQSSKPGLSLYSAVPVAFGTAYYMVSLSVNIVLTILITIRLYLYRRRVNKTLNPDYGTHYFSLATIIIESAASYSICALMFIVTYAVGHPINQIFLAVASNMQQIAGYLIIYRVAEGSAWKEDTFAQSKLGTLRFAGGATTQQTGTTNSQLETPVDGAPLAGMPFLNKTQMDRSSKASEKDIDVVDIRVPSGRSSPC